MTRESLVLVHRSRPVCAAAEGEVAFAVVAQTQRRLRASKTLLWASKRLLWRTRGLHMRSSTIPCTSSAQRATARTTSICHTRGAERILLLLMGEIDLDEVLGRQVVLVVGAVVGGKESWGENF